MAQKEKNHFITTSYQKQWYSTGTNGANLFRSVYDNSKDCFSKFEKRNHGNNKSYQKKLYWKNTKDPEYRISLENNFAKKESDLARVLQKINRDGIINLSALEKMIVVEFATSLVLRSPKMIEKLKSDKAIKEAESTLKYLFLKNGGTFLDYYSATKSQVVQDYIRNINLEVLQSVDLFSESYQKFLLTKFKKPQVIFWDVIGSSYKLLTSNYPVIFGNNIFDDTGYNLIFPVSPTKLMLLISENSMDAFKRSMNFLGMDRLVTTVNFAILSNHRGRELNFDYEIYSITDQKDKILSEDLSSKLSDKIMW